MSRPSWCRRAGVAVCCVLVFTACTPARLEPAPSGAPGSPPSSIPNATAAQTVVDGLVRAARTGDRAGFDRLVSTRDPSFSDRARLLYDNLHGLPLDRLRLRLRAVSEPVSATRQHRLGDAAWRQQADVSWRLAGETATAGATVWLTFVADRDRVLLAGTIDVPADLTAPQPIWWTGPVTAARQGGVTVLAGSGQPVEEWLTRTGDAVRDVRRRVTAGAARSWTGAAVVEVPAGRAAFEAVVGAAPGSYADVAAVTLAEGPSDTAAVRIVVNPEVSSTLSEVGVATLLTHEMVHRATRSADSPAPTWAVEGLADYVAFASHPGAAAASQELLVTRVRQDGPPPTLPVDDRFDADDTGLDLTYAEAWSACRYVAATWSPAALQRLYTALDGGATLDTAARDVLGVSASALTTGWRGWLERQAR